MRDDTSASRDLSEFELIDLFSERAPDPERIRIGIGDDAAVVATRGAVVTSVDTAVEGVHFRREWSTPEQIAGKAVGAALSDLAAMGAGSTGIEIYIGLGVRRGTSQDFLRGLAKGAGEVASRHGATLAGGDTVSSPVLFLAVTVVSHIDDPDSVVPRSGALPGDAVAVTGTLGGARAGLWLLEDPGLPLSPELPAAVRRALIARQLEAHPRFAAGSTLAASGARAMVDVSDGLVADLGHIARASGPDGGVAVRIDAGRIPSGPGVESVALAAGLDRFEPALSGGEDYELAVAISPDRVEAATGALERDGVSLTVIGEVLEPGGDTPAGVSIEFEGKPIGLDSTGFDHFA
ncbi:MAG: thiamine-phosphate kinase [Actinomycetota bacterium]|nr:thiamine-phosphate kinase [Actinomycetota bacterium]